MVDSSKVTHASPSKDVEKKAALKSKSSRKTSDVEVDGVTYYTSAVLEDSLFDINVGDSRLRPSWDTEHKYPIWAVPSSLKAQFCRHPFVKTGRVIQVNA